MSEPGAALKQPSGANAGQEAKRLNELRVSGHLMAMEPGLFCIILAPAAGKPDDRSGLPGVRISASPNAAGHPDAISICAFRPDGWLGTAGDAALVRVTGPSAQLLVTIYQAANTQDPAPRLQVLRIADGSSAVPAVVPVGATVPHVPAAPATPLAAGDVRPDIVAHVRIKGDVGVALGDWVGERGSKRWVEGFLVAPQQQIAAADIEYQAVLGRGWLSPWVEGGQLCGSRGMALPLLGVRFRLRGEAANKYDIAYSATFIDGAAVGPVRNGEACESETLAPLEAFQIVLVARSAPSAVARKPASRAPDPAVPAPKRGARASRAPAPKGKPAPKPARRGR